MTNSINNILEQIYNTDQVIKKVNVSGGIIFKEQRGEKPALLLIQRSKDDHWPNFFEFPRGKCDNGPNEGLIACLKREVKEESGLDIIPLKLIDKFSYTADEGKRLSTQHNYLCKMKDPNQKVKLSKEHQGFQWITTPGEAELIVLPEMKRSIIKAFEMIDPDTQLVNYPENDFTPDGTIEEGFISPLAIIKAGLNDPERKYINKKCGKLKGKEKKNCVSKIKIKMMEKYLSKISAYKLKCSKQPNPERCYKVLDRNEKRTIEKIKKYKQTLKENTMDLQEKIKLSENLVDEYLDEINPGLINAGIGVVSLAQSLSRDAVKVSKWAQQKIKDKKQKKLLLQKQKEDQNKQRLV